MSPREFVAKLRPFWEHEFGYSDETCGTVIRTGYHLKTAQQEGKCLGEFDYFQSWGIPHEERPRALLFLAPPLLCRALLLKDTDAQASWFREMEKKYGLLINFLSFGTVQAVSVTMLTHLKATGERLAEGYYLCTDTSHASGRRLVLSWDEGQLRCDGWLWHGTADSSLGGLAGGWWSSETLSLGVLQNSTEGLGRFVSLASYDVLYTLYEAFFILIDKLFCLTATMAFAIVCLIRLHKALPPLEYQDNFLTPNHKDSGQE